MATSPSSPSWVDCTVCYIRCTSQRSLEQHQASRRHNTKESLIRSQRELEGKSLQGFDKGEEESEKKNFFFIVQKNVT